MATYTDKELSQFTVNKVPSQEIYDAMVAAGQVNSDEIYLVADGENYATVAYVDTAIETKLGDVETLLAAL